MIQRTRAWLRSFVNLGARADVANIPPRDIERQEDTVLRALELLGQQPGVVVADEVGMGKTLEALGVIAAIHKASPDSRIAVITPGPNLNHKWVREFARFSDPQTPFYNFGEDVAAAESLEEFVPMLKEKRIVVAPVSMFHSTRGRAEQSYLLSLYFHWKGLHGKTANAILDRFRGGVLDRVNLRRELFLNSYELEQVEPHLKTAFKAGNDNDVAEGLDDLYEAEGYSIFDADDLVRRALDLARFRLIRALLPEIALLVVDEAHKLKNAYTVRSQAMTTVFHRKFQKAVFLTATPFQLGIGELRQVFSLFSLAKEAPPDVMERADKLLQDVERYQEVYTAFEQTWNRLDAGAAEEFRRVFQADPTLEKEIADPASRAVAEKIRAVKELKTRHIEPGFRAWMIRSLKEDKRQYREHKRIDQKPAGEAVLPFLIYERFIAELFESDSGTHKAAVEINMVSSFTAARKGALLDSDERTLSKEAESYRSLLKGILSDIKAHAGQHPKIQFVIQDSLAAAERGEKTLIFCSRVETLSGMARELKEIWESRMLEKWQAIYKGATREQIFDDAKEESRGRHSKIQQRFHRTSDSLYLALRERHMRSLVPASSWALENLPAITELANSYLKDVRVGQTSALRLDYRIAKRCVERAASELWLKEQHAIAAQYGQALAAMRDSKYIPLGLDLIEDELEKDDVGEHTPKWSISPEIAQLAIGTRANLWQLLKDELARLRYEERVHAVEQLASFLTRKEVTFLADVLMAAKQANLDLEEIESRALLDFVDEYWERFPTGQAWIERLRSFLRYLSNLTAVEQRSILSGAIRTGELVRQTRDGESRDKLVEAFNTPLYPMILIANEVMQEGLDLHHNCRRIVHHDLAWNPAQLEQRVGRIDRLGSKTLRMREADPATKMDIVYPLIERTIDQRLYRTVRTREKWLEFLLGAPPSQDYSVDGLNSPALPDGLAEMLTINLQPRISNVS